MLQKSNFLIAVCAGEAPAGEREEGEIAAQSRQLPEPAVGSPPKGNSQLPDAHPSAGQGPKGERDERAKEEEQKPMTYGEYYR